MTNELIPVHRFDSELRKFSAQYRENANFGNYSAWIEGNPDFWTKLALVLQVTEDDVWERAYQLRTAPSMRILAEALHNNCKALRPIVTPTTAALFWLWVDDRHLHAVSPVVSSVLGTQGIVEDIASALMAAVDFIDEAYL